LPVIVLNTVIGIVQEIRAKKILSKLNVMNTTEIVALRDSKEEKVPIEKLVKGDLVLLKTGDQIPADGKVVKGNIRVNESLLTGESDEITKEVGDRSDVRLLRGFRGGGGGGGGVLPICN
jgi:cation-transporting ATPase E